MTREEELPNEGKSITFLVRMEEVTDQIAPELNEEMNAQADAYFQDPFSVGGHRYRSY